MPNSQRTTSHTPSKEHLSSEIKFLIACCQTEPSTEDINFIFSYLNAERLKLNALISMANQHGILPLVYKTIKNIVENDSYLNTTRLTLLELNSDTSVVKTKEGWNDEILTELKAHYMSIAQRNMLMTSELIKIMDLLRENHIEALAFKGPALAQMAYRDITLRQYSDLDILVKKQDIFKAGEILESNSYMANGSIEFLDDSVWVANAKDMTFFNDKKSVAVEMHWKLFQDRYAKKDHMIDFWFDPNYVTISNKIIKTLETNILLVYLCIHGSMHVWERIEWITDIDRLINTMEIDWDKTLIFAEKFQSKTMFILGLSVTHDLFGTRLPETIMKLIQQKKIIKLKDFTLESLQVQNKGYDTLPGLLRRAKFHANMQDTYANKFKYWQHTLFHQHHKTMLQGNQIKKHAVLLNLTRPFQLIQKYLIHRKH